MNRTNLSDLMIDLQNEIIRGEHSIEEIADIYNVPRDWVDLALGQVLEQEANEYYVEDSYLESMYEDRYEEQGFDCE